MALIETDTSTVAYFLPLDSILQAAENWAGPGNEAARG